MDPQVIKPGGPAIDVGHFHWGGRRVGGTSSHFPGSPVPFWFVGPCRNGEPRLGAQGVWGGFQMVFPRLVPSNWFNMFDYINVFWKGTMRNRHTWSRDVVGLCITCSKRNGWYVTFLLRVSLLRLWFNAVHGVYWHVRGPNPWLVDESLNETFLDVWLVPLCVIRLCSSVCVWVFQVFFLRAKLHRPTWCIWWLSQGARIRTLSPRQCWGMIYAGKASDLFDLQWSVNQSETSPPDHQQV